MDLPLSDAHRFSAHRNRQPGNGVKFVFCASVSYLQDSRLRRCFRLWCDCEFSVYNFRIFVGCFNVVITDVRDVALFVGVLSAG